MITLAVWVASGALPVHPCGFALVLEHVHMQPEPVMQNFSRVSSGAAAAVRGRLSPSWLPLPVSSGAAAAVRTRFFPPVTPQSLEW